MRGVSEGSLALTPRLKIAKFKIQSQNCCVGTKLARISRQ